MKELILRKPGYINDEMTKNFPNDNLEIIVNF